MKKKFRNIEVNGEQYAWSTVGWNGFKIWKNKKVVHTGTFFEKITPKDIRAIIEKEKL